MKHRIIFILVGLCLASAASAQEIHLREHGLYTTKEISSTVQLGPHNLLVIRSAVNLSGKLTINSAPGREVKLSFTKQARTQKSGTATDYIDLISVTLSTVADESRLELRAPNPAPWNPETEAGIVEATLTVPPECAVRIEAQQFDVSAVGPLRELMVASSLGGVEASHITELTDITTANRRVTISELTGDITVATSNSSIMAKDIVCTKGQARFRNDGGDIKIQRFRGGINVRNSFGRTDISDFEPTGNSNYIRSSSGPIILEVTSLNDAQLVVTNQYEDIEVAVPDTVSAYMSFKVDEDGVIEATHFPFRADLVERNRLNLHAGQGKGEISGTVRGKGNIYVRGTKGE